MPDLLVFLIFVLGGIAILLAGGELLVRGATALARRLGIPALIVGLTIVAFGTSAPEMVVSAVAALSGAPGIALGNIVGSNIANVLLVLGIPALFAPIATNLNGARRNALIACLATAVFIVMALDLQLSLQEGYILAGGIGAYIIFLAISALAHTKDPVLEELTDVDHMPGLPKTAIWVSLYTLAGIILLPAGAQLIVTGASGIASAFGLPDAIIGLTIIALGTSLPELATALIAAIKRQAEMAIGNVIGSNIFNLLAVGGITGISTGLASGSAAPITPVLLQFDVWVMAASMAVIAIMVFTKSHLGRRIGLIFTLAYASYIAYLAAQYLAGTGLFPLTTG